jgi:hypothetical protein
MTNQELAAQYNAAMPEEIRVYLNKRGINDQLIEQYQLGFSNAYGAQWITIPIKDASGDVKFFKLRRDPYNDEAHISKYMTLKPSDNIVEGEPASGIFNEEILNTSPETIVITEGEFDCIVLNSKGIPAISFTTGAGSGADRLLTRLKEIKKIIVCYDNDEAGIRGATNMANSLYKNLDNTEVNITDMSELIGDGGDITNLLIDCDDNPEKILSHAKRYLPEGLITAKELCEKPFNPDDKWIIDRILPREGITLISSQPKCYKTWLILYITKCLATGIPLFGKFPLRKSKVLVINEENGDRLLQERLKRIGVPLNDEIIFRNLQGTKIDNMKDIDLLKSLIKKEKFDVIVFDNLVRIHNKEENSATEMRSIFEHLKELLKVGVSIIITHHQNKGSFSGGFKGIRGSSEIAAFVNCSFSLERVGDKNKIIIFNDLCRDDEELEKMAVHVLIKDEDSEFKILEKQEAYELMANEEMDEIMAVLSKFEEPIDIQTLLTSLNKKMGRKKVEKYCHQLHDDLDLINITTGARNANLYQIK